eukprot:gene4498-3288_t
MRIHPVFGYRSSVNVCMVGYCHGGSHLISMLEALAAQSRKGPAWPQGSPPTGNVGYW